MEVMETEIKSLPDKTIIKLDRLASQIIITTPVRVTRVTQDRLDRVYIRVDPIIIQEGDEVDE